MKYDFSILVHGIWIVNTTQVLRWYNINLVQDLWLYFTPYAEAVILDFLRRKIETYDRYTARSSYTAFSLTISVYNYGRSKSL